MGLLVPACTLDSDSPDEEPVQVRFRLDWTANALHAPFFVAAEEGYYRKAGLDVQFLEGRVRREKLSFALRSLSIRGSEQAVSSVSNGEADLAYAAGDAVIEAVVDGLPVKMVAILLDRSPDGVIVDKEGSIDSIDGLEGHRVALPPEPVWTIRIEQVLAANGVEVDEVQFVPMKVAQQVPAFVSKRVQAILGYPHVFAHEVDDFGLDQFTFRLYDLGLTLVGRGVVASERFMNKHPEAVRRFIDATEQGFEFTQRHPEQAMRTLTNRFPEIRYGSGLEHLKAMLRWIDDPPNKPYSFVERAPWVLTQKLMLESGHIDAPSPVRAFFTNRFVR